MLQRNQLMEFSGDNFFPSMRGASFGEGEESPNNYRPPRHLLF
jgi:hypothetical protein